MVDLLQELPLPKDWILFDDIWPRYKNIKWKSLQIHKFKEYL